MPEDTATMDAESTDVSSHEVLIHEIETILPHLIKRKPAPSKTCLEKINTLGWPVALGDDVDELSRLVIKYKFKDALPLAEKILEKLKG